MATQSEKFRKIKEEAKKSGAKPAIKTAAKLASQYNDLSKNAKKAAMAVIDKAYDMATSEKRSPRITTPYKELYAKFLREYRAEGSAKSAWKEGTSSVSGSNRDVVKDAGRPALKKGKRTVKLKGYTTNQYGRFKNKVGSTYYESRSNRMDVNTPVSKKKVKLEYGGMANAGMMTKKKKAFKMPTNEEFNNMTFKEQQAVFLKWADTQGIMDINDPNFMFNNGGSLKKKVVTKDEFAKGGLTEHGLRTFDTIKRGGTFRKPTIIRVKNDFFGEEAYVDLNNGKREVIREYDNGGRFENISNEMYNKLEKIQDWKIIKQKQHPTRSSVSLALSQSGNFYRITPMLNGKKVNGATTYFTQKDVAEKEFDKLMK